MGNLSSTSTKIQPHLFLCCPLVKVLGSWKINYFVNNFVQLFVFIMVTLPLVINCCVFLFIFWQLAPWALFTNHHNLSFTTNDPWLLLNSLHAYYPTQSPQKELYLLYGLKYKFILASYGHESCWLTTSTIKNGI